MATRERGSLLLTGTKGAQMKVHRLLAISLVCLFAAGSFASDDEQKNEEERTEIRQMAQDTLARLYKAEPPAQAAIHKAYGYAVFSNTGIKILIGGSGNGKGVAVANKSKKETFMKMLQIQAGLGFGVKKFRVVFVFDNQKVFNDFVNSGWQFGGQADAAAKTSPEKGGSMQGAASVSDGVWMYQLTDKGVAVEITATGTKYRKDDDLNNKS
ncbi:MAG TPA: YSC84-related protein [Silvibacterium sp.]|nr:YSC84-related protein [Silvibacterium sp.]